MIETPWSISGKFKMVSMLKPIDISNGQVRPQKIHMLVKVIIIGIVLPSCKNNYLEENLFALLHGQ